MERVSVIIPVLNEEACIAATLESLLRDRPWEVIVVDGGSNDRTVEIAGQYAAVVGAPRGRAAQQNRGAAHASGTLFFFLHADCRPEPGWQTALVRAAGRPGFVAGCFRMRIAGRGWVYRAIERGGDLRARWLALPYGDQGIFLRPGMFAELGGFPPVALMEDVGLMRRARRRGRITLVPHLLHVSARRWERVGPVRQTLRNWVLTALALGPGVHPDRLARRYPHVR